jgi:hypothetical protein
MSIMRSATVALSTVAFAATLLTEAPAQAADQQPTATRGVSQAVQSKDTSQRVASGSTAPGQGWVSYFGVGLYIDVDTSSAHFTGTPTYTSTVGGIGGQWSLTGTSAIYSPTSTGFRIYIRWSDGRAMTVADAQTFQWHVNWIGVDNP